MMKRVFKLICLLLLSVSLDAGAKSVTFAFYSGSTEGCLVDSIKACYVSHTLGESLDVIPINVKDGKLQFAVKEFSEYISAHSVAISHYNMIGIGLMGSAVATMCASESSPESLVLISGLGICGKDALRRILTAGSYMANMQLIDAQSFRKQVDDSLCGIGGLMMAPSDFVELKYYDPAQYLKKVKCPVLCVYGTNDSLVEWYENAKAFESILSELNHSNKVLAYMNTGYCLFLSSHSNIPMIGDFKPNDKNQVNASAINDIIDWIKTKANE